MLQNLQFRTKLHLRTNYRGYYFSVIFFFFIQEITLCWHLKWYVARTDQITAFGYVSRTNQTAVLGYVFRNNHFTAVGYLAPITAFISHQSNHSFLANDAIKSGAMHKE